MIDLEIVNRNIGVIRLNHPPLNILTMDMTRQLIQILNEVEKNNDIKSVVITGAGEKAFCVGADIKEFSEVRHQVIEKKLKVENEALQMIEDLSKPVIAALNGTTLGGGCEIALACDIRYAQQGIKIGLPEINLGVFPGSGGLYRLPHIVGPSVAMDLMYTGKMLTADEAHRLNLINEVVVDNVYDFALEKANVIAKMPKKALHAIKVGVRAALNLPADEMLSLNFKLSDDVFQSDDCQEGIDAFFEKRKPQFK